MPDLQLLIKPSSGMCNLRCRYCFYYDVTQNREQKSYGFMTLDTLEEIVKKSLEYADRNCGFAFQGGEPTLIGLDFYKELIRLQKKYNTKGVHIDNSIQTNAYHLGEDWAEFLAENHFLVGVSLDGVKLTHDAYRINAEEKETFGDIMATVELFNRYHVEYNILTVVNRRTAEKIRRIYAFYQKNHFHYLQFIACLDPLGEEPGKREYSLTPELYGQFLIDLFDLWYLDLQQGKQPYIRQFENYVSILMGYEPESCEQRGVCSIQHVIEADGSVYPCDFFVMDEYRIGNLNEDDYETIDKNGMENGFLQESLDIPDQCRQCQYYPICRGGCRRNRMGQPDHLNYFCKSYKMFFGAALPRLQEIAARISAMQRR